MKVRAVLFIGFMTLLATVAWGTGLALAAQQRPTGVTLLVNSLGDDSCSILGCPVCDGTDSCTLRQAISKVNGLATTYNNIRFDMPTVGSNVIFVASQLPEITQEGTWIDGSNAGGQFVDVTVDGQSANADIFRLNGANIMITNLSILRPQPASNNYRAAIRMVGGTGTEIGGNRIGVDMVGGYQCWSPGPNGYYPYTVGILIENGVSGGAGTASAYLYNNTIGCMDYGIYLSGADYVQIGQNSVGVPGGNRLGVGPSGQLMRNRTGIMVSGSWITGGSAGNATENYIRHNTIANSSEGILLAGEISVGAGDGEVRSTYIGNNTITAQTVGGVVVGGSGKALDNYVGIPSGVGITPFGGNTIQSSQIGITDYGVRTRIYRNYIGVSPDGNGAAGNTIYGIQLYGAQDTQVGAPGQGNIISGNVSDGIYISGDSTGARIESNKIGVNYGDVNGYPTAALPNGGNGISLHDGAHHNVIGGGTLDKRNIIAGNAGNGIFISGPNTANNTIAYNDIGIDSFTLTAFPNGGDGIEINDRAHDNALGEENLISYNLGTGVFMTGGAWFNVINNSTIQGNQHYGVLFDGYWTNGVTTQYTSYNIVQNSRVFESGYDGIGQRSTSNNSWISNIISRNGGLGIDINVFPGGDLLNVIDVPFVYINPQIPDGQISGTATCPGGATCYINVFRAAPDPTNYGEAGHVVGSSGVDGSGNWLITDPGWNPSYCYTAVMLVYNLALPESATEFTSNRCAERVFLPTVVK